MVSLGGNRFASNSVFNSLDPKNPSKCSSISSNVGFQNILEESIGTSMIPCEDFVATPLDEPRAKKQEERPFNVADEVFITPSLPDTSKRYPHVPLTT